MSAQNFLLVQASKLTGNFSILC